MIIAQITDLHVQADGDRAYGVVDTNPLVERAIAHLNTLNPLVMQKSLESTAIR